MSPILLMYSACCLKQGHNPFRHSNGLLTLPHFSIDILVGINKFPSSVIAFERSVSRVAKAVADNENENCYTRLSFRRLERLQFFEQFPSRVCTDRVGLLERSKRQQKTKPNKN